MTQEKQPHWRRKWANARNIKFPNPQFQKMREVKRAMGCEEWAEMANELHSIKDLLPDLVKKNKVYKL